MANKKFIPLFLPQNFYTDVIWDSHKVRKKSIKRAVALIKKKAGNQFAKRLNIKWVASFWENILAAFFSIKKAITFNNSEKQNGENNNNILYTRKIRLRGNNGFIWTSDSHHNIKFTFPKNTWSDFLKCHKPPSKMSNYLWYLIPLQWKINGVEALLPSKAVPLKLYSPDEPRVSAPAGPLGWSPWNTKVATVISAV